MTFFIAIGSISCDNEYIEAIIDRLNFLISGTWKEFGKQFPLCQREHKHLNPKFFMPLKNVNHLNCYTLKCSEIFFTNFLYDEEVLLITYNSLGSSCFNSYYFVQSRSIFALSFFEEGDWKGLCQFVVVYL